MMQRSDQRIIKERLSDCQTICVQCRRHGRKHIRQISKLAVVGLCILFDLVYGFMEADQCFCQFRHQKSSGESSMFVA